MDQKESLREHKERRPYGYKEVGEMEELDKEIGELKARVRSDVDLVDGWISMVLELECWSNNAEGSVFDMVKRELLKRSPEAKAFEASRQEALEREEVEACRRYDQLLASKGSWSLSSLQDPHKWKLAGMPADGREAFLSSEEFLRVFGVSKEEFSTLRPWQRIKMKRMHGLF